MHPNLPSETADGDPLIYHRLTSLRAGSVQEVKALIKRGFVLTPFDDRGEDSEMVGLDPIDLAAGDGGAVFCTPFAPVGNVAGKPGMRRSPGVAFKLSTLLECCKCSARPTDLQLFYNALFDESDALSAALRAMNNQVDSIYDRASYLAAALGPALELIRRTETWDVETLLVQHRGVFDELTIPAPSRQEKLDATDSAMEFVAEMLDQDFREDFDVEDEEERESIFNTITETVERAALAWVAATPGELEVLVWAPLPLDKACLIFDTERLVTRAC